LHTEQTRLKASINSLNIGFIMTGINNEIVILNGIVKKMLLYDDPQTKEAQASLTPKAHWTTEEIDQAFGPTINFKKNLNNTLHTGTTYEQKEVDFRGKVLRIFMAPIQEDSNTLGVIVLGVVVLIEDITEVKALERSKEEFFSIASHELRTPLTAVRGNSALLQQIYSNKLNDKGFDDMVTDIHAASVRLIGIVNDFLDATRLEQGKIKFENEAFNIEETLKTVIYELTAVANEKGNTLKLGNGVVNLPKIFADKNRVKQIVYNLVGNAMKFTEKGTITIDAHVQGNMLKVFITDTGPGISEENQRTLFHKFQQSGGNPLTRDAARGTGLGLYISKMLCEQMGGNTVLEHSEVEHGTTFSFSLPLKDNSTDNL
jgi:signal transduction histidine kinase